MRESFAYDKMGNITNLNRFGKDRVIDNLKISYDGNRLKNINELVISSNIYSQKEYLGNSRGNDKFRYDANGNTTADLDRDIVTIRYNLLNLPELIQFRNGSQILNSYDAAGTKFSRFIKCLVTTVVPLGDVSNIVYGIGINRIYKENKTYYCGNYEYIWDSVDGIVSRPPVLSKIYNSEGYKVGQDINSDILHYFRRDHLGNVREVWKSGTPAQTVQRMQYYPSGLPWADCMGADYQNRKYNGKEFIEMHGYDSYDYHARHMFPVLMRFTTIDPLAEIKPWLTPYHFCSNNPIVRVDPSGMLDDDIYVNTETKQVSVIKTNDKFDRVIVDGNYIGNKEKGVEVTTREQDGYKTNNLSINYGNNANKEAVSFYSTSIMVDAMNEAGESSILITSTTRTPEDQVRIMYNNAESQGKEKASNLYKSSGRQVMSLYPDKKAMLDKIYELGPRTVSRHCGNHSELNVIDIAPSTIRNPKKFAGIIGANSGVSKILTPWNTPEKAIHIEIPQK